MRFRFLTPCAGSAMLEDDVHSPLWLRTPCASCAQAGSAHTRACSRAWTILWEGTILTVLLTAVQFALPQGLGSILPLVVIPVIFYFLLLRPNQQKQKQWQEMLGNLKSGDRITTTGGIRGTVVALRDDTLHIRVAPDNIKLEVVRSAIASVTTEDK